MPIKSKEVTLTIAEDSPIYKTLMEIDKLKKDNEKLKEHFNIIIDLIKGCDTEEKLAKLKELNPLEE